MRSAVRTSWRVQKAAFVALFLREAARRLSVGRASWLWILLEPLAHVMFLTTLFGFIYKRSMAGMDGPMFVMTGLLAFFMVRNTALQATEAIRANTALFTYRQVLPIDAVLVRCALEGVVALVCTGVMLAGANFLGYAVVPSDILLVAATLLGLWLFGAGLALIFSIASQLVPECGKVLKIAFQPLYFVSGVMVPAIAIPQPYREILMVNPLLHGMELLRHGYLWQYQSAQGASLSYLYGCALCAVVLGLALQVRYMSRAVST